MPHRHVVGGRPLHRVHICLRRLVPQAELVFDRIFNTSVHRRHEFPCRALAAQRDVQVARIRHVATVNLQPGGRIDKIEQSVACILQPPEECLGSLLGVEAATVLLGQQLRPIGVEVAVHAVLDRLMARCHHIPHRLVLRADHGTHRAGRGSHLCKTCQAQARHEQTK